MTPTIGFRIDAPRPPGVIDNALSAITIGAMEDLGYMVNYAAADPFALSAFAGTQASVVQTPTPSPNTANPAPAALALTDNYTDIPGGKTMYYVRPNVLTETPASYGLVNGNTNLISADGTSALFLEGVTGQNLLIDLNGGFAKNSPTAVADLSGAVHTAKICWPTGPDLNSPMRTSSSSTACPEHRCASIRTRNWGTATRSMPEPAMITCGAVMPLSISMVARTTISCSDKGATTP